MLQAEETTPRSHPIGFIRDGERVGLILNSIEPARTQSHVGRGLKRPKSVAISGGGPAGLYAAISLKLRFPDCAITVFERNRPDDTFGWGVVLSEETLENLAANDPVSAEAIRAHFAFWDDIAVVRGDSRILSTGHGFCGIGRQRLLTILQRRARELGVDLDFETEVA